MPAGTYCDIPIISWDFLPTFYDLAGGNKPLSKELDGGSLRSLLENGNQGAVQRNVEPLVFFYPWYDSVRMSVIRQGDYKLVKDLTRIRPTCSTWWKIWEKRPIYRKYMSSSNSSCWPK